MCLLVLWMIFTLKPVFTAVLVLFTAINMRLFQYLVNKSQNYCRILQYCTKIIFYSLSLKWKHTYCIFVNFKIKLNEYCCVVTSENSRWWQCKKASHEHVNAVNSISLLPKQVHKLKISILSPFWETHATCVFLDNISNYWHFEPEYTLVAHSSYFFLTFCPQITHLKYANLKTTHS